MGVSQIKMPQLGESVTEGTVDKWLTGLSDYFVSSGKLKSPADPKSYYLGAEFTAVAQ
jgi:NitT/TauT family transport system substrate-binding protein